MDYRESRFLAYCDCIIGPLLPIFDWCVLTLAPVIFLEVARAGWPSLRVGEAPHGRIERAGPGRTAEEAQKLKCPVGALS